MLEQEAQDSIMLLRNSMQWKAYKCISEVFHWLRSACCNHRHWNHEKWSHQCGDNCLAVTAWNTSGAQNTSQRCGGLSTWHGLAASASLSELIVHPHDMYPPSLLPSLQTRHVWTTSGPLCMRGLWQRHFVEWPRMSVSCPLPKPLLRYHFLMAILPAQSKVSPPCHPWSRHSDPLLEVLLHICLLTFCPLSLSLPRL